MPLSSAQIVLLAAAGIAVTIAAVSVGIALAPARRNGSTTSGIVTDSGDDVVVDASDIPSLVPSYFPTLFPSPAPSFGPSSMPSDGPTFWPTIPPPAPSDVPSYSPTRQPIDPNYSFRMMLHWELEFMWQNETIERKWCLECVRCDPISTTEFGHQDGCVDDEPHVNDCYLNDQLWTQECEENAGNAEFQLIRSNDEDDDSFGDQVMVKDTDLCIERTGHRMIVLGICNATNTHQKWIGFDMDAPFAWSPNGLEENCVSQHHHPKPAEVIYAETCFLAHKWDTALWDAI